MPSRSITIDGKRWDVTFTGRVTANEKDEFGLLFIHGAGADREIRVTRYSPMGARWRDQSLAEMTEQDLRQLFEWSQPSFTSPEAGYRP